MSSNSFGTLFKVTTFGESHGLGYGAVIDGVPPGLPLDEATIQVDLERRRPGRSATATPRKEADRVRLFSGVFEGVTTGAPVGLVIDNRDAKPGDYEELRDTFRPGHADWVVEQKFGIRDWRGGGRTSGRETVARVAAGAVARALLATFGAEVVGMTRQIAGIDADFEHPDWQFALDHPLRCPDRVAAEQMEKAILAAKAEGDSVGGIVEVRASGVPPGLGEPVFDKLDARLGAALLSIGAVKGVEIGSGFAVAALRGSQANDPMTAGGGFASNHAGGVLGGISNGAEIVVRAAIKPTSSIGKPQQTIDRQGNERILEVKGRHDPCIVPRLVAVAEAMVCLVLADAWVVQRARQNIAPSHWKRG